MPFTQLPEKVAEALVFASIGFAGGTAHYFYQVSKGTPFKLSQFLINAVIGSFIAWMVGQFVPPSSYQHGLVGLSAISSYVIMQFIETEGLGYLKKFAEGKLPPSK
jgi:hypothetical protein